MQHRVRWALTASLLTCAVIAVIIGGDLSTGRSNSSRRVAVAQSRRTFDTLDIRVDPRVELMSILCRLAEYPEYKRAPASAYTRSVDEHFKPYRNHSVVNRMRELRTRYSVSYDAPMSLAVHLSDIATLQPLVPLDPLPATLDVRWRSTNLPDFLRQLRDFTTQTRFDDFLQAHQDLYAKVVAQARQTVAGQGHLEWFDQFFDRTEPLRCRLMLGMLAGTTRYNQLRIATDQDEIHCVLGIYGADDTGLPQFDAGAISSVVASGLAHYCVDPIIKRHMSEFQQAMAAIHASGVDESALQGYGSWSNILPESIVQACVMRYLLADGTAAAERQARNYEAQSSFRWVHDLPDLLAIYEQNREQYRDFEDFLPRIAQFLEDFASQARADRLDKVVRSRHLLYHHADGDSVDTRRYEAFLDWFISQTGITPAVGIQVFRYRDRAHMQRLCGMAVNGFARPDKLEVHTICPFDSHELTHVLVNHETGNPPALFSEGIAMAYSMDPLDNHSRPTWASEDLDTLSRRYRNDGQMPPLAELLRNSSFRKFSDSVTYPIAGSFVRYLMQAHGVDRFLQFLRRTTDKDDPDQLRADFQAAYDLGLDDQWQGWLDFLETGNL